MRQHRPTRKVKRLSISRHTEQRKHFMTGSPEARHRRTRVFSAVRKVVILGPGYASSPSLTSPRAPLHVVGMLRKDISQPSLPTPFHSFLVSISVFMAVSTVFHSRNSLNNSSFGHSVLPVFSLPYWSFHFVLLVLSLPYWSCELYI